MKMNKNHKTVLVILNIIVSFLISSCSSPKEQVRIGNGTFTIEGKDIQLICGEMHYPRIPHEYWRDRLKRASAMGLNTVSAYVFWNFHERQPGEFDFSGQADIAEFIRTAQEEGLYVILRPGPYVCAASRHLLFQPEAAYVFAHHEGACLLSTCRSEEHTSELQSH